MAKAQEKTAAYIFGVSFISCILLVALFLPEPTSFQLLVFRVVLSLAAGGVAAMIPGFLEFNIGNSVRAGGALAVFAVIYFANPAELVASTEPGIEPAGSPRVIADAYLEIADRMNTSDIWSQFSDAAHRLYTKNDFLEAYETVRLPLGQVSNRSLVGVNSANHVPGWPNGHYRTFQYSTTFKSEEERYEHVTIMSEKNNWVVVGHTIHKIPD